MEARLHELSETPWRLYALDEQGEPVCLCACDEYSIGEALLDHRRKGKAPVRGIMFRPFDDEPGEWLVNPWEAAASGRLVSATREPTEGGRDE